jgi:hypothetical protein
LFFEKKPKPVQTGLARFFRFGLVFLVWLGFGSVWLGFFLVLFCFGSVRFFWFFAYKTETEPADFFKILIGFFFRFGFFGYLFSGFLGLIGFSVFLLTPSKEEIN